MVSDDNGALFYHPLLLRDVLVYNEELISFDFNRYEFSESPDTDILDMIRTDLIERKTGSRSAMSYISMEDKVCQHLAKY